MSIYTGFNLFSHSNDQVENWLQFATTLSDLSVPEREEIKPLFEWIKKMTEAIAFGTSSDIDNRKQLVTSDECTSISSFISSSINILNCNYDEDMVANHLLIKEGNHQELRIQLNFMNKFGKQTEGMEDAETNVYQ